MTPAPFPSVFQIKKLKAFSGDAVPGRLLSALLNPGATSKVTRLCLRQLTVQVNKHHMPAALLLFFSYSLRIEAMVLKKEFLPSLVLLYTQI